MIRVVLVDDHAVMRAGFRMILTSTDDIEVVGEASTGREAIAIAHELQPDVICMDVQMPGMDGLEETRQIVADPAVGAAIVVVTTFDRDDYVFQALQAGASGFLLKNAGPDELISAVRVAAAGDALLAPEVTKRVIERFSAELAGSSGAAGAGASGAVRAGRLARAQAPPLHRRALRQSTSTSPIVSAKYCACWLVRSPTRRSRPSSSSARQP